MTSKKLVVTGGSGLAGRSIVSYLAEQGYEIRNVDLMSTPGQGIVATDPQLTDWGWTDKAGFVRCLYADLTNLGNTIEILEGAEAVIHLAAIARPGLRTVEVTFKENMDSSFNIFRQRPADLFFEQAQRKQVAVLARLPLSSGMLTGKMRPDSHFAADDHRQFNRHGEAFDVGETFSGFDYALQLEAVEALRGLVPEGMTMAQFALRWITMFDAVTCTIPGGKRPAQVEDNCRASDLPPLSAEVMSAIRQLYLERAAPFVHQRW